MRIFSTKPILTFCMSFMMLSACSSDGVFSKLKKNKAPSEAVVADIEKLEAQEKPAAKRQNLGQITVAEAAKVSNTELKAATDKPVANAGKDLGKTIVSLGLLDEAGFWLQTPLVNSETEGRVTFAGKGKSANIRLIPNGAPSGSGSQMSIAAMQLLGIAITDLAEVQVFTR